MKRGYILLALTLCVVVLLSITLYRSQCLLTPSQIALRLGIVYGEPHARILKAQYTLTDNSQQPMYYLELAGQFQKGQLHASRLAVSTLAQYLYAFGISGYEGQHQVWVGDQWPDIGSDGSVRRRCSCCR